MENSNQPALRLQDVSKLSAKREQGESTEAACVPVGMRAGWRGWAVQERDAQPSEREPGLELCEGRSPLPPQSPPAGKGLGGHW